MRISTTLRYNFITSTPFSSTLHYHSLSSLPSIYFSKKVEKAVGTQPEKSFLLEKKSRCGHNRHRRKINLFSKMPLFTHVFWPIILLSEKMAPVRNLHHKVCGRSDGTVLLLPYPKSGPLKLHQQCGYQQ